MDLPQIRTFVALAELKHFGRAADRLNITQPALTKRLRLLEGAIGAPLFERNRTGTILTPVGTALLPNALRIAAEADAMLVRARHVVQGTEGRLDIGFGLSTIDLAPRLIARFRRTYPAVAVSLNDGSTAAHVEGLLEGRLDIGFVRLPLPSPGLACRSISRDGLALAYPRDRVDVTGVSDLGALNDIGFVMLDRRRGPGLRAHIDRWCAGVGLELRIIQVADDLQTVLALVAGGVGLALVPRQAGHLMRKEVGLLPIAGADAQWAVGVAWRSGRDNPSLRNFLAIVDQDGAAGTSRSPGSSIGPDACA